VQGGDGPPGPVEPIDADDDVGAAAAARAEEALIRFLPQEDGGIDRVHHVTALVVSYEGAPWLPRTLDGLSAQRRPPDAVIGIDAGSSDDSEALLGRAVAQVVAVDADSGLAGALAAGVIVEQLRIPQAPPISVGHGSRDEVVSWYWILHDDSAPEPECLAELLAGADRNPKAHVLVPKSVAWSDPSRLVGIGNRWSPGTPLVERLEPRERDQGQYDVDRPVYSGNSAGMLVRADTWHALGGIDPQYGQWAGAADLCRRVWGSGAQVMFVPRAVVAHRQAGHRGVRRGGERRPAPRRAARHGQLLLELTQAPAATLPWRWVRGWLSTVVRALALLLTREPEEATAELAGAWDALAHPGRIRAGRRALRRSPRTDSTRPAHVRAPRGTVLTHSLDAWLAASRAPQGDRSWRPPSRVWRPWAVAGVLAAAALVRDPAALLGSGTLRGGGLLPAPAAMDLLSGYLASWQDVRFGVPSAQPAHLPLLAAASVPLLGSVDLLVRLLFGLAVPLAFLSAYASIGTRLVGRHRPVLVTEHRVALALAWATLPAAVAASSAGRLSTLALVLLGPPTARLLANALESARRPGGGIRPAIAAGTLLGVTSAFAPLAYVLVALAALGGWIGMRMPRWPLRTGLVVLAVGATFLVLWIPRLLGAPWLLLSDVGRNDPTLTAPPAWPLGLAPGGPTSVPWAGLPVVVAATVAVLLLTPTLRMIGALVFALGLLAAVAWAVPAAQWLWPQLDAGDVWLGQPLLVAGGLLIVLLARAAGRRGAGSRVMPVVGLACAGTLLAGWWLAPSVISVGSDDVLPPVVALDQGSAERPRALVLARDAGLVRYGVATSGESRLGDADTIADPEGDPEFDEVVEAIVSGASGDLEVDLGGRGIRYVVFNGGQDDALVGQLDSAVGLRRLASSAEQSLWLVAGEPVRATLVGRDGVPEVVVPITERPTSFDVVLHPDMVLPRALQLAERTDRGWRAELAGDSLELIAGPTGMVTARVQATGPLSVHHRSPWTALAVGQLLLIAGLVLLSLPKRRTLDLDGEAPA
jgi:GT2 family glycosyltransferase